MNKFNQIATFAALASAACSNTHFLAEHESAPAVRSDACVSVHLDSVAALEEGSANENIGLVSVNLNDVEDDVRTAVFGVYDLQIGAPVTGDDLEYWVSHQFVAAAYPNSYENFAKAAGDAAIIEANIVSFGEQASDVIEVKIDQFDAALGDHAVLAMFVNGCSEWARIDDELEYEMPIPE